MNDAIMFRSDALASWALTSSDAQQGKLGAVAARTGRILLRREPSVAEVAGWRRLLEQAGQQSARLATLVTTILSMPELEQLPAETRTARAYDAMFGRYDANPPRDLAHWQQRLALGDDTLETLIKSRFAGMLDSDYRFDPSDAPVDPSRPFFVVASASGAISVFAVGTNARLYLFRGAESGPWTQTDLSAALPAPANGHVQSVDVRRTPDGKVAIALAAAPRRGTSTSVVYAAIDLADDLSEAGWSDAIRSMHSYGHVAETGVVSHVELAWQNPGTAPLLLVGAMVQGIPNTYYQDLSATQVAWTPIRLPEDADEILSYAIGTYVRTGIFVLYRVGSDICLTFTAFADQYGKTINVAFEDLPANVTSFQLHPTASANKPDIYVAGDGIVVYRSGNTRPEQVTGGKAARLVGVSVSGSRVRVAYTEADAGLSLVTGTAGSGWVSPVQLAGGLHRVALAPAYGDGGVVAAGITLGGALELLRLGESDALISRREIEQHAVWSELPLTRAELDDAMRAAAPVVYFATDEAYFSSTVEFFLGTVGLWNEISGQWQLEPGTVWDPAAQDMNPAALASLPRSSPDCAKHDSDYVLKIDDTDQVALRPGHPQGAPFYVHAKFAPALNATDLVYWIFCPFNGAGLLKLDVAGIDRRVDLAPLGEHEGDWEHFVVRVDNDSRLPTMVYLSAHDGGQWVDVDQLERDPGTGRIVLYTSRYGHAFYFEAGDNLLAEKRTALYHIGLINHCDKGQRLQLWEPGRLELVAASFIADQTLVEPAWLQFPWRWGRYKDFTAGDVAHVVQSVMGFVGSVPGASGLADVIGAVLVDKHVLGDEGNSAGPGAIKFKGNWFGPE